jgi:hypothetical protein
VLSELQIWFADQLPNRRLYPRRPGPFRVWLRASEGWEPLIGVDVAAGGIGVMSLKPLPWGNARFAAQIGEGRVEFDGSSVWVQEGTLETKRVWRGGFRIRAIGSDDWRAILDFCNASLPAEEHVAEPPLVRMPAHEAERLLPSVLRERITDLLAKNNRVTLLGTQPNLQFQYGGVVHYGDGLRHKLSVTSQAVLDDKRMHVHETAVYFDDALEDVSIDSLTET